MLAQLARPGSAGTRWARWQTICRSASSIAPTQTRALARYLPRPSYIPAGMGYLPRPSYIPAGMGCMVALAVVPRVALAAGTAGPPRAALAERGRAAAPWLRRWLPARPCAVPVRIAGVQRIGPDRAVRRAHLPSLTRRWSQWSLKARLRLAGGGGGGGGGAERRVTGI
jgi:hypothetical protein